MHPIARTPVTTDSGQPIVPFPFDVQFQAKIIKLILTDDGHLEVVFRTLKPQFFSTPELRWSYQEVWNFWAKFGKAPTLDVLVHNAKTSGGSLTPTLVMFLDHLRTVPLQESEWLRGELMEWSRQNFFAVAFKEAQGQWNQGDRKAAVEHMTRKMDEIQEVAWKDKNRMFLAAEIRRREQSRVQKKDDWGEYADAIPTGIPELDKLMNGGLSTGELGIWIAYMKGGKSTMLLNHGAVAADLYKHVAHFVLEGSVQQVADRYDAWFAHETYWKVKTGNFDTKLYEHLVQKYDKMKEQVVLIGLLDFDVTIHTIQAELTELRRSKAWSPDLIIIDYGDLVSGRNGPYQAPWMSERDAFRDMKMLANRGYAVWTASQARRADTKSYDDKEHLLKAQQVAGGIEKARVTDFMGSINSTVDEKKNGQMRLYAELYRDNAANEVIHIQTEPDKMRYVGVEGPPPVNVGVGPQVPQQPGIQHSGGKLGYK